MILLLGMGARVVAATSGGLWRDEAQMLDVASLPTLGQVIRFLTRHESHPPLYYILMRGWTSLAGNGDGAVVLPGLLFGGATIGAVWRVGRVILSPRVGLLAAALVAASPYLVRSDAMVRPYALLSLLTVVGFGLLWRAITADDRKALAGWVACSVLLLYTHSWTVLPVLSMGLVGFRLTGRGMFLLKPSTLAIAVAIVFLAWLPWLPFLLSQAAHGGHILGGAPVQRGLSTILFVVPGLSPPASICLVLAVLLVTILRWPEAALTPPPVLLAHKLVWGSLLLTLAMATAGTWVVELLLPHVVFLLSPLALLGAVAVLDSPGRRGRVLSAFALVVAIGSAVRDTLAYTGQPRSNAALMASFASGTASPTDLILVMPSPLAASFLRYYTGPARVEAYPRGVVSRPIPFDDWWVHDADRAFIDSSAARARRVLEAGGSVWQVADIIPKSLRPSSLSLEAMLTEMAGPPTMIEGPRTRATLEQLTVQIWSGLR